jgi:hypothetical protein
MRLGSNGIEEAAGKRVCYIFARPTTWLRRALIGTNTNHAHQFLPGFSVERQAMAASKVPSAKINSAVRDSELEQLGMEAVTTGNGCITMRVLLIAFAYLGLCAVNVCADEYKSAVVKGIQNRKFVFEVDGREIQVSPGSTAFKAFDASGRQLTPFPENYRVLKAGNVVNLVTVQKRNTEYIQEIHLVKGELLEAAKPQTTTRNQTAKSTAKTRSLDQKTYTAATIKSVNGKDVVLVAGGMEISLVASGAMKAFDASGHKLSGSGQNMRVLKEGNQVTVTTFKNRNVEVIREIHLVQGALQEK